MPDPSPSTLILKLQLLTARKKEWWPATADSLSLAVYLSTVKHTALAVIEPTTFQIVSPTEYYGEAISDIFDAILTFFVQFFLGGRVWGAIFWIEYS